MDETEDGLPFNPSEEDLGDENLHDEERDFDLNEEGEIVGGGGLEEEEKDY